MIYWSSKNQNLSQNHEKLSELEQWEQMLIQGKEMTFGNGICLKTFLHQEKRML
jgi:hypothetical protein